MLTCMPPDREDGGSIRIHRTTTYGVSLLNPIVMLDNVMPLFSVWHESAALGCEVDWGDSSRMPDGPLYAHPLMNPTASLRAFSESPDVAFLSKLWNCSRMKSEVMQQLLARCSAHGRLDITFSVFRNS